MLTTVEPWDHPFGVINQNHNGRNAEAKGGVGNPLRKPQRVRIVPLAAGDPVCNREKSKHRDGHGSTQSEHTIAAPRGG